MEKSINAAYESSREEKMEHLISVGRDLAIKARKLALSLKERYEYNINYLKHGNGVYIEIPEYEEKKLKEMEISLGIYMKELLRIFFERG